MQKMPSKTATKPIIDPGNQSDVQVRVRLIVVRPRSEGSPEIRSSYFGSIPFRKMIGVFESWSP